MVQKIVDIKDPKLHEKSRPIAKIDKKVLAIITDLKETLKAQSDPEGVGLAAPQIGKNLRVFLINYNGIEHVMINPEILSMPRVANDEVKRSANAVLEGCLSLPHYYGPIKRAKKLTVKYQNEAGEIIEREFKGFLAHIIQHEVDHLNGVVFIDRILEQKVPLYKFKGDEYEEVEI